MNFCDEKFVETFPAFKLFTEKGQRIFKTMDSRFDLAEYDDVRRHEVFFDHLPVDLFEDEFLPFLCRVGRIYQIRFIMNFSGLTKGKAYVIYETVEQAYRAVEELDDELIRADQPPVRVKFSVNNRRLMVHNVPAYKNYDDLKRDLNSYGISGINFIKILDLKTSMPCYREVMLTFDSHESASKARRIFVTGSVLIDGSSLKAIWAKPYDYKCLFVLFNKDVEADFVQKLLENDYFRIKNVRVKNNMAFVKYQTFSMANNVKKASSHITSLLTTLIERFNFL
ncbi:hypothetical protein NH340_JMT00885 [Sarcoptes scabiei]|nr:hypothetical protein NH340_JMT00885 [Sarcoptes scabiei]